VVGGVFKNTPITGNSSTLEGNFAHDQIIGANSAQQMIGSDGDDVIIGNGGDDTLYGGTKSTVGETFNSTLANLYANNGNDILFGGEGNDKIYGETGDDQASYAGNYTEFQTTILSDGTIQVQDTSAANGSEGTDILSGIEQINFKAGGTYGVVTGGSGNDILNATPY
jgi:Ca2+-binding RTX toxin-like protein